MDAVTSARMRLDVLGAGPAYTDKLGAAGASYLMRAGSTAIVLDLGQGSFPRLAATLEPSSVDAVFVSHLHPDHFIDLVAMRHYLRWQFEPERHVRVIAPTGLAGRIDALHDEPGFTAATLDVEPIPDEVAVGPLRIQAIRVTHTADSHAFRVSLADGPGLVYTGDCGRARDVEPLIVPGDWLLSEVSFGPGPVAAGAMHLDGPAVGELAASSGVGRVLLTHLQMGFDADATVASVRARYDGPVELVHPGSTFTI
ncbi:MAG TPA: MBL fold metallo-hydrolase [Patescibacteria group bacterium]|nr:MBL fold metallo-hydrolase [Patescibacteria group bacterium]